MSRAGLFIAVFLLLTHSTQAQQSKRYYRNHPVWIAMMDDSTTNYFVAVKAFDLFWQDKERPLEEDELIDKDNAEAHRANEKNDHEHLAWKNDEEHMQMSFYYKRFMDWKLEAEAFVQPNGHILTLYERRVMWEKMHVHQEKK
jgi:hypothetical protein